MSTEQNQLAVRPTASAQLAAFIGMEPRMMLDTVKAQCFKCDPTRVSDAQLAAFVSIANEMRVNPLLPGMLYAYPSQGAIVPMMGPDGVYMKLASNPAVDGWDVTVYPEDPTQAPTHAVAKIYRKGSERPLTYTAVLSEWKLASNPNWNSRPRHMLTIRALKQCARQVIHGIPFDEDERVIMDAINVTGTADTPPVTRPAPRTRSPKGAAAVAENPVLAQPVPVQPAAEPVTPEPPAEPAPAEVAPPPANEPSPVSSRAFLQDGETLEAGVKVVELKAGAMKSGDVTTPSVKAKVSGGYVGEVYHLNGAKESAGAFEPLPPWKVGVELKVVLVGKKNSKGTVVAYVQGVEAVPEVF